MVKAQPPLEDGRLAVWYMASRILRKRRKAIPPRVLRKMLSQKHVEGDNSTESEANKSGNGAVTPGAYSNGEGSKEFLSTGRTGRRNALPDILGQHADTGTADLSTKFEALSTESGLDQPGPSGAGQNEQPTTSQQHTG